MAGGLGVKDLVDGFFFSYNAARLREACHIYADKMLEPDVTVGMTISGALTPPGLGYAVFVPLVEAGFVDWIVSTGANLYHDIHRSLGFSLYGIAPNADDVALRRDGVIRIYDIVFDADVLYKTDAFIAEVLASAEMRSFLDYLETQWDVIVIDGAAMSAGAGSAVIAPVVDGVVLVAAEGQASSKSVEDTVAELNSLGAHTMGLVYCKATEA